MGPLKDCILGLALAAPLAIGAPVPPTKPIKVFILAGDECVLEEGVVDAEDKSATLEKVVAENPDYAFLKDQDGKWITRDDVKGVGPSLHFSYGELRTVGVLV